MPRETNGRLQQARPAKSHRSTKVEEAEASRFPGGGGSTRDVRAHQATLQATRELLAEVGYARLTIEGIAQRAGVGKPTIYRWWRSKADIVYEAVWAPRHDLPPDTGELASDLRSFVERLVEFFSRPEVAAAFPGLVSDMFGGTERVSVLHDFSRSNLAHLRAILMAARGRGELRPGVDLAIVTDLILGAVISRVLADTRTRRPSPASRRKVANAIVDVVLQGIAAPDGT